MNVSLGEYLKASSDLLLATAEAVGQSVLDQVINTIANALVRGKPFLVCGNGGSASDAMHIAAELVGRFLVERRALRVICLSENPAFLTAWSNDSIYDTAFARQVEAYGEPDAVLLGISTSGNSRSIIEAVQQAKKMRMVTIALTGATGGAVGPLADHLLAVPSGSTPLVQQVHVCIYHYVCRAIEERLSPNCP